MLLRDAKKLVATPDNVDNIVFQNGKTDDIIKVLLQADKYEADRHNVRDLALRLRGRTDFESCKNVWTFVKGNIKYKVDEAGYERIKAASKTIFDGFGD